MNNRTLREIAKCAAVTLLITAVSAFVLDLEQRITTPEATDETQAGLPLSHPPALAATH